MRLPISGHSCKSQGSIIVRPQAAPSCCLKYLGGFSLLWHPVTMQGRLSSHPERENSLLAGRVPVQGSELLD